MCGLFQPICQVRFTNVATVRLKVHGERFEIACYKNKVVNWRSGVETDIQEVLQSPYIFTSISKGKLANNIQLMKAFNTTDINKITKQILDKGEFQISKEERNQILESTFRDIVSILHEVTINPNTGHPLTRSLLENALKSSGFSVSLNEPPKKQALKALSLLQKHYPESIARCKMRLRVNFLSHQYQDLITFFQGKDITIEQNSIENYYNVSNSSSNASSSFCTPNKSNKFQQNKTSKENKHFDKQDKYQKKTNKESDLDYHEHNEKMEFMLFVCPPKLFREIEDFILNKLDPPGTLQLITLNIKDNPSSISTPIRSPYQHSLDNNNNFNKDFRENDINANNENNNNVEELLLNKVDSMKVRQSDSEMSELPSDSSKELNRDLKIQKINEESGYGYGFGHVLVTGMGSSVPVAKVTGDGTVITTGVSVGLGVDSGVSVSSGVGVSVGSAVGYGTSSSSTCTNETKLESKNVDFTNTDTNKKRCLNCNIEFDDNTFYRKHFKSDFHVFNSKRKLQGLDPISQDEYQHIQSHLN